MIPRMLVVSFTLIVFPAIATFLSNICISNVIIVLVDNKSKTKALRSSPTLTKVVIHQVLTFLLWDLGSTWCSCQFISNCWEWCGLEKNQYFRFRALSLVRTQISQTTSDLNLFSLQTSPKILRLSLQFCNHVHYRLQRIKRKSPREL